MGKPQGLPAPEPADIGDCAGFQLYGIGRGGRLAGLSGLFLPDQYSYFDLYHRAFYFPDVAVEEPGAHFYPFVRVYRADLVLYTG